MVGRRTLEVGAGLLASALMFASCSGGVHTGPASGGEGGVATSGGGEPSAGAGAAGEAPTSLGGRAMGEAGGKHGSVGAGGVVEAGGAAGHNDESLGGAGDAGSGPECAGARDGDSCNGWDDGPCVSDIDVCLCDVSDFRNGFDVFSWRCFPRGCPAMPPGPQQCTTTTRGLTQTKCEYGDRVCTCDAQLGWTSSWKCPMVCPGVRPPNHQPCAPSALTPNSPDDKCTYDSGTCQCQYLTPQWNYDAEWMCADNEAGGASN